MATGGFLPPVVAELLARTDQFHSKMNAARTDMEKTTSRGSKLYSGLASAGKVALAGVAGAAAGIAAVSIKAALEGEAAHARLVTAITNAGAKYDDYGDKVEDANKRLADFGFENDDVESSLATLTNATKNPAKALRDMTLVADIARGRNISLAASTAILTKVETGHVGLLSKLGIQTKDAAGKTIDQETAVRRLGEMYGGAAARNAETFSGKVEALKAKLKNTEEQIGQKLIPIFLKVIEVVQDVIEWFSKHRAVAIALAVVIGGLLLAATIAWTVSLFTAGGALAFLLSPITLVVLAVAALAAGIIYVWTHWDQIWGWISHHKAYAAVIAVIFPITAVVLGVIAAARYVKDHWSAIWNDIKGVVSGVGDFVGGIFDRIISGARGFVNGIITIINGLISAYNHVPFHKDIDKIPYLEAGGGGGGLPTAANPSGSAKGRSHSTAQADSAVAGASEVHVHVHPLTLNGHPAELGNAIVDALVARQKSTGPLPLRIA